MSGGRIELGLGAGWFDDEHRAYAIPFPPMRERFERLEEQFEILTGLWTTPVGDRFSYDGRHYTVADSPGLPKPAQSPHPPVIVGGAGPTRTPRLAARFADEFNVPFHGVDDTAGPVRPGPPGLRGSRPGSVGASLLGAAVVCCGADEAELGRRAAAIGRDVDELRTNGAAGSPAEVADRLRAYGELGATTVYLQVLDLTDLDHLRLIAEEVVPRSAD